MLCLSETRPELIYSILLPLLVLAIYMSQISFFMKIKLACCKNSPFRNFHYTRSEKIQKEINWHTIKSTNKLFYFLGKNSKFFEKMNVELTKKGKWSVVDTYKFWNLNLLIIKFDGLGSVKVSFSKNEVKMPIWKQCQSHFFLPLRCWGPYTSPY